MKKTTEDGREIKSRVQKMYKVGFGSNTWGLISEDSIHRYSNIIGYEEHGERTIYYIDPEGIK